MRYDYIRNDGKTVSFDTKLGTDPRSEGEQAGYKLLPQEQNPYRKGLYHREADTLANQWDKGWLEGRQARLDIEAKHVRDCRETLDKEMGR